MHIYVCIYIYIHINICISLPIAGCDGPPIKRVDPNQEVVYYDSHKASRTWLGYVCVCVCVYVCVCADVKVPGNDQQTLT